MLRKFLIPTVVVVSILLLLTTLTSITEATSVTTSTSKATTNTAKITKAIKTIAKTTTPALLPSSTPALILTTTTTTTTTSATPTSSVILPSNPSATVLVSNNKARRTTETELLKKFLNNAGAGAGAAAAAVVAETETTTSLLPLQPPLNVTSTTLASLILNQKHQQQQRQLRQKQQQQLLLLQQRQNRQNLDSSFVTVSSAFDVVTPEPSSSTHAYIPFDLDYNDPTEEKAARAANSRQSTINEVLSNLFPKGFSDIFRFSYVDETETVPTTSTPQPITVIKSSPAPFKPMPSTRTKKKDKPAMPNNSSLITVTTSVTREIRREVRPGHVEIVVEKIFTQPSTGKSNEDFSDGSNSISKDEFLRINRAAKEASVLPSLLVNPQTNSSANGTSTATHNPIVILDENNNNDDFVDAPEDDNQIAETQDVVHQVYQPAPPHPPPPAESTNFHATPTHQYNVRIIHDDSLRKAQDQELVRQQQQSARSSPSYQSFVEQSKLIQNSLQEAPSRKFLKNFQNPILSQNAGGVPITKGNFHYEKNSAQNHIQTVLPAAQVQYVQQQLVQPQPQVQALQQEPLSTQPQQQLHAQVVDEVQVNDKNFYHIGNEQHEQHVSTPANLVFVTINPPVNVKKQTNQVAQAYAEEAQVIPAQPMKSPHEFVSNAMAYFHVQPIQPIQPIQPVQPVQLVQQQQQQPTAISPPPPKAPNNGYTFVEVQKSINIHNKLITEKDGRLVEQHETIYPQQQHNNPIQPPATQEPAPEYVSLSQNPIHVEQEEEQHESAASLKAEQHAPNPVQDLGDYATIQQSNLIQETHIIEAPQQLEEQAEHYDHHEENQEQIYNEQHVQEHQEEQQEVDHEDEHEEHYEDQHEDHYEQQHEDHYEQQHGGHDHQFMGEEHSYPDSINIPQRPNIQIPYALPAEELTAPSASPLLVQGIVEKHVPVPYGIPEPVGIPVHIQHFIDRPFPVETIVERPVPYPVETVVEKVVEKHVPIEVEKIIEKPVEKVVKKYIDRPIAIPIKIPVALHLPPSLHGPPPPFSHPPYYGPATGDYASTWPQMYNGGSFARTPTNILKSYYTKMLKKLVPQMQQAYKSSPPTKVLPKLTPKPYVKPNYKISDMLYDLKPPPRPKGKSIWDVGARYQYDYNTLPLDLSGSGSIQVSKQAERQAQGFKTNFDEFQRWRNGHSLKRSPDFGRNLHMEYGFTGPSLLVPSVEIDDKGVPLKSVADLTKGKEG
ncbi:hypothetical protein DOY81_011938 [Sarcophaga bullata]|nr:hypothetical protein DOY81_011938 [Sarcophaga bullata]